MNDLTTKTERLTLRPFRADGAPRVRALANDFEIARMVGTLPYPYPEGLAESWIATHPALHSAGTGYPFAVEIGGVLAGSIGVESGDRKDYELGYWLGRQYWARGFASEAAAAVMNFAFGRRALPYARARFISDNAASRRVLVKTGFLATGRSTVFHTIRACDVEMTEVILTRDG
jgi:RimJ/RimL family protein N-acetyltransferase